jgi:hypothetical protein
MSRLPKSSEWTGAGHGDAQIWTIGIDSIAIIVGNTWITQATPNQIAQLYCTNPVTGQPFYNYWDEVPFASGAPHEPIIRVIRDHTSGTYDCFQNFFLAPAGSLIGYVADPDYGYSSLVPGFQELQNNADVYQYMTTNPSRQNSIAFIGMGFLINPGLHPLNIYNSAQGQYYAPTEANVLSGLYPPIRNLWHLTAGVPTVGSADAAKSVWISYMRLPDPTNPNYLGSYASSPNLNFISQEGYINILRDDFTSANSLGNEARPGQTQYAPDNLVTPLDLYYYAGAYSTPGPLNPYVDLNADGVISPQDTYIFTANY